MKQYLFALLLIGMCFGLRGQVSAETTTIIHVADGYVAVADDGKCSLIEAIENAPGGSPHADCSGGTGSGTVIMLAANGNYLFDASTANIAFFSRQLIIDGNGATLDHSASGFFNLNSSFSALTLRNITIQGSVGSSSAIHGSGQLYIADSVFKENVKTSGYGGAIELISTGERDYSFVNVTFEDNVSDGRGGAIYIGTSAANSSVLIDNATFIDNGNETFSAPGTTNVSGGAVYITSSGDAVPLPVTISNSEFRKNEAVRGGALYLSSDVQATITDSTFDSNAAVESDKTPLTEAGGAIYTTRAIVNIEHTTISNNRVLAADRTVEGDGGLLVNIVGGGGITNFWAVLTVKNSTFSGNQAIIGGALSNRTNGGGATATASLEFVTMTKNLATYRGGAIYNRPGTIGDVASITVRNSYVAGNIANGVDPDSGAVFAQNFDCRNHSGTLTSFGYNIASATALNGCPFEYSADSTDISPALSNNGGATKTHAIPTDSVARNKIPAGTSGCDAAAVDQRGHLRDSGSSASGCDIGAYETGAVVPTAVAISGQQSAVSVQPWLVIASMLCLLSVTVGYFGRNRNLK